MPGAHRPKHAARMPLRRRALWTVFVVALIGRTVVTLVSRIGAAASEAEAHVDAGATTSTSTRPDSTVSTSSTTRATTRDPMLGNGQSVTIAFAGDTFFEGVIERRLAADPASVLAPVAPVLAAADIAVVNMETAIGVGGAPENKSFTFQAPPVALEAYRAAGVDVVSAANNHGMDFGIESFHETLQAERALGFPIVGIGANEAEAYAPQLFEVRGQRIAVLAASQMIDDHLVDSWTAGPAQPGLASALRADRLVREVSVARMIADTVVVFLHWGVERQQCPADAQRTLAHQLVDAGADIVVGSHAHQLLAGGRMGDAVVHYGLGNFAFSSQVAPDLETGIFVVTVTGHRVDGYQWLPARMVERQPVPLEGPEADAARADWEGLRGCADVAP